MLFEPVSAEKQRIAEEVASMLKLSIDLDTSSPERLVSFLFSLSLSYFFLFSFLVFFCIFVICCLRNLTSISRLIRRFGYFKYCINRAGV